MNAAPKLAGFGVALAAMLGLGAAAGAIVGPIRVGDEAPPMAMGEASADPSAAANADGLSVAAGGFRLVLDSAELIEATPSTLGFHIVDDQGRVVTGFAEVHERRLHLIVLSRNLVDYAHLHPEMATDGRWSVDMPGLRAGSYRLFTDFQATGGPRVTLGADVVVPGELRAFALPAPSAVAEVDGYQVTLGGGSVVGESTLAFSVSVDDEVVHTDAYLGAAGHLVAIREGDLAYLHVHPLESGAGAETTFAVEYPSAGTYRLFLDFSHGGAVHTAAFTVVAGGDASPDPAPADDSDGR